MSRRNGSATSERRSPKRRLPRFHELHLVPCPLAPDQISPSARTLKAIQESWGNLTICEWFQDETVLWCSCRKFGVCCSEIWFLPLCWAQMCSSQWRDLLFVSCVVAERSPASRRQTQHPALVDRNFRTFSLFLFLFKPLFISQFLVDSNTRHFMVGWLFDPWALSSWHLGFFKWPLMCCCVQSLTCRLVAHHSTSPFQRVFNIACHTWFYWRHSVCKPALMLKYIGLLTKVVIFVSFFHWTPIFLLSFS